MKSSQDQMEQWADGVLKAIIDRGPELSVYVDTAEKVIILTFNWGAKIPKTPS